MGSYVESTLSDGENIQYRANVSIWSLLPLFIFGLILLPFFGVGLLFWIWAAIRYFTTEMAVTDRKVIAKTGFISRNTIELLLSKVESIRVDQSILGRMLNYGSIVVAGGGNPQAPIPGIASPLEFRKHFVTIQEKSGTS